MPYNSVEVKTVTEKQLLLLFRKYNQEHVAAHLKQLRPDEKRMFSNGLEGIDIGLAMRLYSDLRDKPLNAPVCHGNIEPASVITIPRTPEQTDLMFRARQEGESLIRDGKVAVLIVAGGQGSRLNHEGSKGTFPISPVNKKSLFQLFGEQVRSLCSRYATRIPLLIMTSRENHQETVNFFRSHNHFGLNPDEVYFFQQAMLPSVTPEGKLILKDRTSILTNPDGHGGSLKSIYDSGHLKLLLSSGISELFYCQVDNPLVRIADPVFLGYHRLVEAECSTKVVRRRGIDEKVGVYLRLNGADAIIEYSEISSEHITALDEKGDILYWPGNTAIHIFSLSFVERLNDHGYALPYHRALKEVETADGKIVPGWKFETFVFDAIPLARKTCCVEVAREEEFSPVKNRDGTDSPATARRDMCRLYQNWLRAAGVETSSDSQIEISPILALDKEEFVARFSTRIRASRITIKGNVYLG